MKTLLLLLFCSALCVPRSAFSADGRVITENGTNILCLGIDQPRSYTVVRFYLAGTNVVELRADDIVHGGRKVFDKETSAERDALLTALRAQTNVTPANTTQVVSNLVRLQLLEDAEDNDRKKPKK
jgi:hypothetical protein